jgi:formate hydrogenlyase subunit 3/multisubunit Na+/H+ antiporter MnhD subunit
VFGIVVGVIIVLFGLSLLLQQLYGTPQFWWPSVLLIFGVLIIIGAIYRMRRRD